MTLVIGTDEAGYGPNLGPLVVAATAWESAAAPPGIDHAFARAGAGLTGLWGDSKRMFRGGAGFAAVEQGALAAVRLAVGSMPDSWSALARALGVETASPAMHGSAVAAPGLPREASGHQCLTAAAQADQRLAEQGIALRGVRCRVVEPGDFNALLDQGLNKSDILSRITLDLAAALMPAADRGEIVVWCDRHGGRMRYAPLVSRSFAAPLVQVIEETPLRSAYRLPARSCRIEFHVQGESRLPVAVASMTAKYVRELAMHAFNAHWASKLPGLRPTAGYPVDAGRWRSEAAAVVDREGVAWDDLWRRA
jgi:hypothetical protein